MKIRSFLDEKVILKKLLKDKRQINKNPQQKLIVYIKYLKAKEKTKIEIRNELDNLMELYYGGFIMADWDELLRKFTNKYTKKEYRDFRTVSDINITRKELNFIKDFKNIELEKLLFILLVLSKSSTSKSKKDYWVNCDSKDMFSLSKFKYERGISRFQQREFFIHDIAEKIYYTYNEKNEKIENHLIEIAKQCDSIGIKLLYVDDKIDENGITIHIKEGIENTLVLNYLKWRGDKMNVCKNCGIIINKKSSKTKYCKKCAKKKELEKYKRYNKKRKITT